MAGWNWISFPLNISNLKDVFHMGNWSEGDYIKSQTRFARYYSNVGWVGMDTLNPASSYMMNCKNDVKFEIEGIALKVDNIPYRLERGWNWVSFPFQHKRFVDDVFQTPFVGGDLLVADGLQAVYNETEERFSGSLTVMQPGSGYRIFLQSPLHLRFWRV